MANRRADDYEHDDYEERLPRKKSTSGGGNTAVKIIAIIGAVVLGILLVCGGVAALAIYFMTSTVKTIQQDVTKAMEKMQEEQAKQQAEMAKTDRGQAQKFAESFLKEIRDNHLDSAYQATSADYQKRVPRKQFEQLLARSPGLKWFAPSFESNAGQPTAGNKFVFRFTAPAEGKIWHPFLTVVKDGLNWKVDDINGG